MTFDSKNWYAKVKYFNGDIEDILVRKIKTSEGNQFSPRHVRDFDSNILYTVKTAMNDVEGKEQRYYAYIGKLAENIEKLKENDKRISWPTWPSDIHEEPENTSQDERQQNSSLSVYRKKAALKKSKKRVAEAEEYQKFLNNSTIERTESRDLNQTTQKSTHEEMPSIDYNKNLIDILQDLKDFVSDKVQKMEEKLENMREACENTVSKIVEVIEDKHSTTSGMSSDTENKVHLGSGYYCTNASFKAMEAAKNDCDWAVALLVGVFDEEAKLMRVYPRKQGLKKFPLGFLMLAQNLYKERLIRNKYEGDIDKIIKALPAYLSDRALDLTGGRGTASRAKRLKKDIMSKKIEKETVPPSSSSQSV